MTDGPLIVVVHSTTASIAPAAAAVTAELPTARVWNLLDDRLGSDAEDAGTVTPALGDRMSTLIGHGLRGGADAALVVCSMYGAVTAEVATATGVPVVSSDAHMIDEILHRAPRRVAVLASLRTSAADSSERISHRLRDIGSPTEVVPIYCSGAAAAASAGDEAALAAALTTGIEEAGGTFDLICIAQYSLAPAHAALARRVDAPVISAPVHAARAIAAAIAPRKENRP